MDRLTEKHFAEPGHYIKCSGENPGCDGECVNCVELEKIVDELAAYEDTGLSPEEIGNTVAELAWVKGQLDNIVQKFGLYHDGRGDAIIELLKMGSEGRLLPLPCAIGSTVYVIGHKFRAGWDECWINTGKFRPSDLEKIGERVFLNYEEAKAKVFAINKDNPSFRFIERSGGYAE